MGFFSRVKNQLKLVYDDDLIGYLKSISLYEEIVAGRRLCRYCGKQISLENLEIILPKKAEIEFVCSGKNCLNQL